MILKEELTFIKEFKKKVSARIEKIAEQATLEAVREVVLSHYKPRMACKETANDDASFYVHNCIVLCYFTLVMPFGKRISDVILPFLPRVCLT